MGNIPMTVTRVFRENYHSDKRINLNRGSIRASKTYSLVQLAVLWLTRPYSGNVQVWSIVRKTLPALKASAYRDFREIVDGLDLWPFISSNLSDMVFTFGKRSVEFFSLDEATKIKSRKRNYLHIVEVTEIDYRIWKDLITRTSGKVYADFNPDDPFSWVREKIEEERTATIGDVKTIISTYKDNPYLDKAIVQEIEYLKVTDPELWEIYGLGKYGSLTDIIFRTWEQGEYTGDYDYQYIAIDYGFSSDPAAVLLVGRSGSTLYLKELIYERGLLNNSLAAKIKSLGYAHLPAVADSAEPKSTAALNAEGLNVSASIKGPDSVRSSIMAVREYKLVVDPGSLNMMKELRMFKWHDKKAGVPVGTFDHLISALRYAVTKFMRRDNGFTYGGSVSGTKPFSS